MNISTKDIITCTRKTVVSLIAIIYRSACDHPFVLGMVFVLLLLYRFLPYLFGFLVSSSPVIICTALLLGALLSFGQPNIPEIEEETTHDPSPPQVHAIANDLIVEEDENYSVGSHIENREKVEGIAIGEAKFNEQVDHVSKSERGALLSASNEEEERKPEAGAGLPLAVDTKQIHIEDISTNKGEVNDGEKAEIHKAKLPEDATELAEHAYLAISGQNNTEVLQLGTHETAGESQCDSSLVSSWKVIDKHDASESDSDHAESSSPDASMADIIPMLDELHPLLDSEDPQPVNAPVDDLHSMSGASTEDGESDDGSAEEEAENQGVGEEEEEEEEAKEENEDGAALAVKWTEDDAKNLIVLGTSELERNQTLENLIAKRRARKNLRVEAEKNLIDLDAIETLSMTDELAHIKIQIPPISTARRNPFDLPYDSEESIGLPPIPGSAPSVLLPRRNPFDLPHDQADESGSLMGVSHQGFGAVPQREMFFRRHESFAIGASFTGNFKQEKHDVKLRPYFVTERTDLEGTSYAHFQRQLSEQSDSKVSSVLESESVSSVADQDCNDELSEQQLHQQSEFELVSSAANDAKHVEREINSSDDVDLVDPLCRHKEINICSSHNIDSSTSEVFGASLHEAIADFINLEEQNSHVLDLHSPISDTAKSDVSDEKYSRSISSCSTELSMKNLSTKSEEGSMDLQQPSDDSLKGSSGSVQSVSGEVEVVNDCHVVEPVYDSSPSAVGKSVSNIASLEEELLHGDKGSFKSASSLSSETLETSGLGSPPVVTGTNIFSGIVNSTGSMGQMPASDDGGLWVAPSNLASVEENESRSREVGEIREQDVIQVEFTEGNDEYHHPTVSTSPESAIEQIICYSSSSSTETDSNEDSTMDIGMDFQFGEPENDVEVPHSDVLCASDYLNPQMPADTEPSPGRSTVQASSDTFLVEQQAEILPSVPNDISEYFKHEVKYENASTFATNEELIGSPNVEVTTCNPSDVEQDSSLHRESTKEIGDNDDMNKKELVPENGDVLTFLRGVHIPDGTFNGTEVSNQAEGMELPVPLERIKTNETECSNRCSTDSKNEALSNKESGLPEDVNGSGTSYAVHAGVEETKRIDDEALLLELDAIGDFHVEEIRFSDSRTETIYQHNISKEKLSEQLSHMKSEAGGSEALPAATHLELVNSRDLQEVEARSLEDIHVALKYVSEGTAGNPSRPVETKCALEAQEAEARTSGGLHMQVPEGPPEATAVHVEGSPTRMKNKDISDLVEIEARSLADIDVVLKHVHEGTADDPPELNDKRETEVEVTERNLENCIFEAQTSEKIDLAGAVSARETGSE